ncbi:MAG: hypothetical protein AAGA30_09760 [Planctomycetota bacterium]
MLVEKSLLKFLFCLWPTLILFAGCAGKDPDASVVSNNDSNMKRLANLYVSFQMKNEFRGPQDEAEFKKFIQGFAPTKLERINVDPANLDGLFINERDGEPFKIRYGISGSIMGCTEPAIFETTGSGGAKMIGFLNMVQKEVGDAEYQDLWEGKGVAEGPTRDDRMTER